MTTQLEHSELERLKDAVAECYADTGVLCRTLFPRVFHRPLNKLSRQITESLDAVWEDGRPQHQKIVVSAPRGLGKTSIIALGYAAKQILFRKKRYIPYITASGDSAVERTENLKRELLTNEDIRSMFGSIKTKRPTDVFEESFGKEVWVAKLPSDDPDYRGTCVLPRGAGQQIRGRGFDVNRPDLIIGDDIDDPRYIQNEKTRENVREWWFADVMPSFDRYSDSWQAIYIGTLTHEDCLLARLMKSREWHKCCLSICDEQFKTLDPDFIDQESLDKIIADYEEMGMLDVFCREYMMLEGYDRAKPFMREQFQYISAWEMSIERSKGVEYVVFVDPIKNKLTASSEAAIVGVGVDRSHNVIYVRDVIAKALDPAQTMEEAVKMAQALGAKVVACETAGLGEWITVPFRMVVKEQGGGLRFMELQAKHGQGEFARKGGGKEARIWGLVPFFRRGQVYFNPACCAKLEQQLLDFPSDRSRKDVIDAFAYVVQYLDQDGRPFGTGTTEFKTKAEAFEHLRKQARTMKPLHRRESRLPAYMGGN